MNKKLKKNIVAALVQACNDKGEDISVAEIYSILDAVEAQATPKPKPKAKAKANG